MYPVSVNLYDLSQGMARQFSQMLIGKRIDCIPHTGIVVYGTEYYFGGGICSDPPARTPYGSPIQNIKLGSTDIPQEMFLDFLQGISTKFSQSNYDLFKNNCNNFSDDCAEFLTGEHIPAHITDLPNEVLKTPMGAQIMNMVNGMQNQAQQQSSPMFNNPQGNNMNSNQVSPGIQGTTLGTPGEVFNIVNGNDLAVIKTKSPVCIIDFYADWCPPCKQIAPVFQQ